MEVASAIYVEASWCRVSQTPEPQGGRRSKSWMIAVPVTKLLPEETTVCTAQMGRQEKQFTELLPPWLSYSVSEKEPPMQKRG